MRLEFQRLMTMLIQIFKKGCEFGAQPFLLFNILFIFKNFINNFF